MKSNPKTTRDETTTVRVVALETPSGRCTSCIAFVKRNRSDGYAEHKGFDNAVADIGADFNTGLHLCPEGAGIQSDQRNSHDPAP